MTRPRSLVRRARWGGNFASWKMEERQIGAGRACCTMSALNGALRLLGKPQTRLMLHT